MIRRSLIGPQLKITDSISHFFYSFRKPTSALIIPNHRCYLPLIYPVNRRLFSDNSENGNSPLPSQEGAEELTQVASLIDGCDYEHWLVVMDPPTGYPQRDQIIQQYIQTLAMALGSEEEAKKSMYSVSSKYYYAFGCKIPEKLTQTIKFLPNVRWVLPDSYQHSTECDYGGEPFVNGAVVEYDDKYHGDWLHRRSDDECRKKARSRRSRRKQKTIL